MDPIPASPTSAPVVTPLERLSGADIELAGGKAANLGELLRGGFKVPPGFATTTQASDLYVRLNDLEQIIFQELSKAHPDGASIREAFEYAAIPVEIERAVLDAYAQMGGGAVAVRSSATAEDLPQAAFAGQQETYLNVTGEAQLLEAVRRCWASLWTERAIAYRNHHGIDQRLVKLAVVVQRMVQAEAAGVLFTANPVTGARHEMVIDASPGLGEAVVAGLVTPDHYVIRRQRHRWAIDERRAGQREVVIQGKAGGGTQQISGSAAASLPALPDPVLLRLARLGQAIQRHFGRPQDVEWAWADGELFILQARPITALPSPPPRRNRAQRLVSANFSELFLVRPYPLDLDTWIPSLNGALEPLFTLMGLRWSLLQLFEVEDGIALRFKSMLPRPTWRVLFGPLRVLAHIFRYNPLEWKADPLLAAAIRQARNLEERRLEDLSWNELLQTFQAAQAITRAGGELRRRYFPRTIFALIRLRLLLTLVGRSQLFGALITGSDNKTIEANRALEDLAALVRAQPHLASLFSQHTPQELLEALPRDPAAGAFLEQLQAFMDSYGHREAVISTAALPTWKDAPEVVLGIVKSFAAHPVQGSTQPPAWQAARDELVNHLPQRLPGLRSVFLETLTAARAFLWIREDTHFYATLPMPALRRTFLECGRRLVQAGILDNPEDVFHLTLAELERAGSQDLPHEDLKTSLKSAAQRRKASRARLVDTPLVDPRAILPHPSQEDVLLYGMPGSPGEAVGPVCIVQDAFEFDRLKPGDVLVAPFTNPSWTPLFERAAAVVVDTGSLGSHAAIVAREYRIPAVMSTVTGTRTLVEGERVRVDGSRGAVYRAGQAGETLPEQNRQP